MAKRKTTTRAKQSRAKKATGSASKAKKRAATGKSAKKAVKNAPRKPKVAAKKKKAAVAKKSAKAQVKKRTAKKKKVKKAAGKKPPARNPESNPATASRTKPKRDAAKKKAPRTSKVAAAPEEPEDFTPPPLPKTRLSSAQLQEFRQLLLDKRQELVGDVDNLTNEALRRSRSEAAGDLSSMPIHMADIGSDNWEQEFTLGLINNERTLLKEIDDALHRIDDRTYGVCMATHKPITIARLRAKPWAKYTIEYARLREQGRAH